MRRAVVGMVVGVVVSAGIAIAALAWWTYPLGAQPVPTPPPSAPVSTAALDAGTFWRNETLGFALRYPSPWRRSACYSSVGRTPDGALAGTDLFLTVSAADEIGLRTAMPVGFQDVPALRASAQTNEGGRTARQWVNELILRTSPTARTEDLIINGKAAVRVFEVEYGYAREYIFATSDRIFRLSLTHRGGDLAAELAALEHMARSFEITMPAVAPNSGAAAAAPGFTTALASAFAAADAVQLAALITTCRFVFGVAQGSALGSEDPAATVSRWRARFASGDRVAVDAASLTVDAIVGTARLQATLFESGREPLRTYLLLKWEDGGWRWSGMLFDLRP